MVDASLALPPSASLKFAVGRRDISFVHCVIFYLDLLASAGLKRADIPKASSQALVADGLSQ